MTEFPNPWFHGTHAELEQFDEALLGSRSEFTNAYMGVHFTRDLSVLKLFTGGGGFVLTCELQVQRAQHWEAEAELNQAIALHAVNAGVISADDLLGGESGLPVEEAVKLWDEPCEHLSPERKRAAALAYRDHLLAQGLDAVTYAAFEGCAACIVLDTSRITILKHESAQPNRG